MKTSIGIFLSLVFSFGLQAQYRCGVPLSDAKMSEKFPAWQQRKSIFEAQLQQKALQDKNANSRMVSKVYTIPVVVHVIHNNAANFIGGTNNTNISDDQIKSQIKVLNEDYRKKTGTNGFNTNAVGADMEIEFVLASKDPNGNATTGITRTYTKLDNFDFIEQTQDIAKIINWGSDKYLNIWVVRSNGTTIGFSGFPYDSGLEGLGSTLKDIAEQEIFDGVIVDYRNFGLTNSQAYNLGRTTTHEVGHWLGLLHPTGDTPCGTDYCNDTPTIESLNGNLSCNPITSTCKNIKVVNMIENYMDYSPDRCMNVFTNDQKNRTRNALLLSVKRARLLASVEPLVETQNLALSIEPNPNNPLLGNARVKITFSGQQDLNISVIDLRGTVIYQESYAAQKSNYFTLTTSGLSDGMYVVKVTSNDQTSTQRMIIQR
jgi:hypothetical protein